MKKNIEFFICTLLICMLCSCSTMSGASSLVKEVIEENNVKPQKIYSEGILDNNAQSEVKTKESLPIALTTLEPFAQGNYLSIGYAPKDICSDVKGNSYPKDSIFYPNSGTSITSIPKSEDDGRVEYYIDGNYSALTGTLYLPYASRGADKAEMPSTFKVYGDGVLLYEAPEFKMGITEPLDFSVDISNVRSLKIVILGLWRESGDWIGTYYRYPMVCATNLMLSK